MSGVPDFFKLFFNIQQPGTVLINFQLLLVHNKTTLYVANEIIFTQRSAFCLLIGTIAHLISFPDAPASISTASTTFQYSSHYNVTAMIILPVSYIR